MNEFLVYENLSFRLFYNCSDLADFCDGLSQAGVNLSFKGVNNPFGDLAINVIEHISSCFVKNAITGLKANTIHDVLNVIDKPKAVEFKRDVLSNFVLDDFVIPESRGGYLKLYTDFISQLDCLKKQLLPSAVGMVDFRLSDYKRDLKRFSSMDYDGFDLKRSEAFIKNRANFFSSIRDKNYEHLLWTINEYDNIILGDDPDNICKIIDRVPKKGTNKIASIINIFNLSVLLLARSYLPNTDLMPCFNIIYVDYSKDINSFGKLGEDAKNLYI